MIVNEAFELDRLDEMKFRDLLKFAEEKVCTKFTATYSLYCFCFAFFDSNVMIDSTSSHPIPGNELEDLKAMLTVHDLIVSTHIQQREKALVCVKCFTRKKLFTKPLC